MVVKREFIMRMPVSIEIIDNSARLQDIAKVFSYFREIDERFSTYKKTSEVEKINSGKLKKSAYSNEMKTIIALADKTTRETRGYFTTMIDGRFDPSGIVKGYAIHEGAKILKQAGYEDFSVEIGGDIEVSGLNSQGKKWRAGIRNPFQTDEIVKVLHVTDRGVATSGTYLRGSHIYDPVRKRTATEIASITVIGPNICEADRFATAVFAMGEKGIEFIESLQGFDAYMITKNKRAIFTSGFDAYLTE